MVGFPDFISLKACSSNNKKPKIQENKFLSKLFYRKYLKVLHFKENITVFYNLSINTYSLDIK